MKLRFLVIVLLASSVLVVFATVKTSEYQYRIKTYFNDARGLSPGAPVRVAGVNVGRVTSVRVRAEVRDRPAEVTMLLQTSYRLKIPSDAVVHLESEGVLGPTYPEIEIGNARGPALADGGTLKSQESTSPSATDLVDCFARIVHHKGCKLEKPATEAPAKR